MTPTERLDAAIARLEQLRDATRYEEYAHHLIEVVTVGPDNNPWQEPSPITGDELLITLHRTLDAQLAILRNALAYEFDDNRDPHALALADAIMGGGE